MSLWQYHFWTKEVVGGSWLPRLSTNQGAQAFAEKMKPADGLDRATSEMPIGSKLALDAKQKLPTLCCIPAPPAIGTMVVVDSATNRSRFDCVRTL